MNQGISLVVYPVTGVARAKSVYRQLLTVVPPLGQYRAGQLVNLGFHRWAFRPEVGVSRPFGRWTIEGYTGVWLFTTNDAYFPDVRGSSRIRFSLSRRTPVTRCSGGCGLP